MGDTTEISWTDRSFNPWEGCTKVSAGCANCYAEARDKRFTGGTLWGKGKPRRRTSVQNWNKPLRWNREARPDASLFIQCGACGFRGDQREPCKCDYMYHRAVRPRVFCASLADWLDDEVPIEWLADLLLLIGKTPNLDWQLLTKRPQNFKARLSAAYSAPGMGSQEANADWIYHWAHGEGCVPNNVWIGTSVENQDMADLRIPQLLSIPAKVRFLSVEPMLGQVDFSGPYRAWLDSAKHVRLPQPMGQQIQWAIYGGESGAGARPCYADWIRDGVAQCRAAGIKPFVKQMGSNAFGCEMDKWLCRMTDKKGGNILEWTHELQVREFPV